MLFPLLRPSGLCPETHSLFVKREAKTLIRSIETPYPESRDDNLWRGCGGGAVTK
jgi:hypothetical protein